MLPTTNVNFGTPSLFNPRRKAFEEKDGTETPPQGLVQGTPCTPNFDGDTPSMLRRVRSPPPSPPGLLKRDTARAVLISVVGLMVRRRP
jgi:hypothetical protein